MSGAVGSSGMCSWIDLHQRRAWTAASWLVIHSIEPTASYRAACGNHRDNAVVARRAGVRTLVLTHITPALDVPGVREQIVAEIGRDFHGQVIWGEDLLEIEVV